MKPLKINCAPDGTCTAVYSDELAGVLASAKNVEIKRASHVEPTDDGKWQADLSPVGGPTLAPTALRQQSLDAEVEWLHKNLHCL